jgi:hypothetical protein
MGQNRSDTGPQRAAKRRRAEERRCPTCGRGNALRIGNEAWDDTDARVYVTIRQCRWTDSGKCTFEETLEKRIPFTEPAPFVVPSTFMECDGCREFLQVTQKGVMPVHDLRDRQGNRLEECPGSRNPPRTKAD